MSPTDEMANSHGRWSPLVGSREYFLGGDRGEVDSGDGKVGVAELALKDVNRHPLAYEFDCVAVAKLVWRDPPANTAASSELAQRGSD